MALAPQINETQSFRSPMWFKSILKLLKPHSAETSFDKFVRWSRILFSAFSIFLAFGLILWPYLKNDEVAFTLSYEEVFATNDMIKMINPTYKGTDALDRLFTVSAESGMQLNPGDMIIELENLFAELDLDAGAGVMAKSAKGTFNFDKNKLELGGDVRIETTDGYEFSASNALFDMENGIVESHENFKGIGPLGTFEAQNFKIVVDERRAIFEGSVIMNIDPTGKARLLPVPSGEQNK